MSRRAMKLLLLELRQSRFGKRDRADRRRSRECLDGVGVRPDGW